MSKRLYLDDLHVGQTFASQPHVVDAEQIKRFAAEFDPQPFHLDEDAAYYFRYLEPHLREAGAAKWLLEVELEQIVAGEIDALGKRFVGTAN